MINIMSHNYQHYGGTLNPPIPMEPVSRTYQYRKIMKPMLERKRRARINKCLDELKELLSSTLNADSEHVAKLEKADILEMTVRHLQQLRENKSLFVRNCHFLRTHKFWDGFQRCTADVQQFLFKHNRNFNCDIVRYFSSSSSSVSRENCQKQHRQHTALVSVIQQQQQQLQQQQSSSSHIHVYDSRPPTLTIEEYNVWRPW